MMKEIQLRKKSIVGFITAIIVLLSLMSSSVFSSTTKELPYKVSYFVDASQKLKAEQIVQLGEQGWSAIRNGNYTTFGLTKSVYWFKVEVNPQAFRERDVMIEVAKPQLEHVTFYYEKQGQLVKVKTGASVLAVKRPSDSVNFVLPVSLSGTTKSFYISVQTSSYMTVPIHVRALNDYLSQSAFILIMNGIYYGVLLGMLAYNFFLYKRLQDKVYLIYFAYLISAGLLQLVWDGYVHYWFYPHAPEVVARLNAPIILIVAASLLAFVVQSLRHIFAAKFVQVMKWGVMALLGLAVLFLFIEPITSTAIATQLTIVLDIVALVICLWAMRQNEEGRIYALALSVLMIGVFINVAVAFKWLPYNLLTLNAPKIGNGIEMILLSIALGRKIQLIRLHNGTLERQQQLLKKLYHIQIELVKFERLDEAAQRLIEQLRDEVKADIAQFVVLRNKLPELLAYTNEAPRLTNRQMEELTKLSGPLPAPLSPLQLRFLQLDSYKHVMLLPIWITGELYGFILLQGKATELFPREDLHFLSDFMEQVAWALQKTELIRELRSRAEYDSLTGLLSRQAFMDEYERAFMKARQSGERLTVIMVDVDYFKHVNDTHGHIVGDAVLKALGHHLRHYFYADTIVARFGGEEFIGFTNKTMDEMVDRLEKLRAEIANTSLFVTGGTPNVNVTVSIGVAGYTSGDYDAMALIDRADQALYRAKTSGRNQVIAQ